VSSKGGVLVAGVSRWEPKLFKNVAVVGEFGVLVLTSLLRGAGKGLFADRDFAPLDFISEYCGEYIDHDEAVRRRSRGEASHIRCVESLRLYIDGFQSVDECLGKGGAAFANDARDNALTNSKYCTVYDKRRAGYRVFLRAICHIKRKEEVYVSYGRGYWK
jgi:SET domain